MATIDTMLFEQFAEALNDELAVRGARLRISRTLHETRGMMILEDAEGRAVGSLPDHVDAAAIVLFEAILFASKPP